METTLTDPSLAQLHVTGIFVADGNVYCSGWGDYGTYTIAKYWKNGVRTNLGAGVYSSKANSVFVSGTDVYVAGEEDNATGTAAMYWKNEIATTLNDGNNDASASSIYLYQNDVYVVGATRPSGWQAIGWKNGNIMPITQSAGQNFAYAVFVK